MQMVPAASLEQATQPFELQAKRMQRERALKASPLVELRQVWEKPEPRNRPERLVMPPRRAWRSGRQALVSFAPIQPPSIPLHD